MELLMENQTCRAADRQQPQHQDRDSSFSYFLTTHLPIFAEVMGLLEVDKWLHMMDSKFRLLHCTEFQKTLYTTQQLRGSVGAWWASYAGALPADHQVP
jgi:hypothetical protein